MKNAPGLLQGRHGGTSWGTAKNEWIRCENAPPDKTWQGIRGEPIEAGSAEQILDCLLLHGCFWSIDKDQVPENLMVSVGNAGGSAAFRAFA